jgi:hypothetical protein
MGRGQFAQNGPEVPGQRAGDLNHASPPFFVRKGNT